MLAKKNEYIEKTIVTLHEMTEDEKIAEQCRARERYERDEISIYRKGLREGREEGRAESEAIIAEKNNTIAEKNAEIERLKKMLEDKA